MESLEKEIEIELAWLERQYTDDRATKLYEKIIEGYNPRSSLRGVYLRFLWRIQMDRCWPSKREIWEYHKR